MAKKIGPRARLSPKQARFCREYLIDLNATQAAIRAGYSAHTADRQGHRLLKHAEVKRAIAKGQNALAKKAEVTAEKVIAEMALIGFSNMQDFIRISKGGDPIIDLSTLTRAQAAALSETIVEDFTEGRGEDARAVRRVKIKLHDKLTALVNLGKHLGLFIDRHELTGKNGGPLQHETKKKALTKDELRDELIARGLPTTLLKD